jgi:hypothetical protein
VVIVGRRRPRILMVLGMHRSGTSLAARMLSMMGVRLGEDLATAPAADNKFGYWEHRGITKTQDLLLAELARTWYKPRGLLPLPRGWLASEPARAAAGHLKTLVATELAGANGALWGFKDPRTVRLLPMLRDILEACNAEPIYVLCVRRPGSVVRSLVGRNKISPEHARYLWVQHNLDAFREVGPEIAAILDYDCWFERPDRNLRRLLRALGGRPEYASALTTCRSALAPEERHHNVGDDLSGSLDDMIYAALIARVPRFVRTSRLRRLALRFDRAATLFGAWREIIEAQPLDLIPTEAWERDGSGALQACLRTNPSFEADGK